MLISLSLTKLSFKNVIFAENKKYNMLRLIYCQIVCACVHNNAYIRGTNLQAWPLSFR